MSFFQYKETQFIERPTGEVWSFMSDPRNLAKITPKFLGFQITSTDLPEKVHPGMIISYKVAPLFRFKTTWVTEITHVKENEYFVDEQRVGPYKIWHHQHILIPQENGTLMKDIVSYQPPFGFLGVVANALIIRGKLREIFDHRRKVLTEIFR